MYLCIYVDALNKKHIAYRHNCYASLQVAYNIDTKSENYKKVHTDLKKASEHALAAA